MKLISREEKEFEVLFNGTDYKVPVGEFEVNNEPLGYHIIEQAKKWDKDVEMISMTVREPLEPIIKEEEQKKEPVKSATPKKTGATSDTLPK